MRDNKNFEEFGRPFAASDVSWKLQLTNKEKTSGLAVPYLDARAIADRLDAVVGQNRWKDEYKSWHNYVTKKEQKFAQLCTIYIYDEELKEWIGKTDGAEDSDIEPIKGGLSDAFKRAAVRWNIGRYLYRFDPVWVDIEPRGDSYVIAKKENDKLARIYNDTVVRMFGTDSITMPVQKPVTEQKSESGQKTASQSRQTEEPTPMSNNTTAEIPVYEIKKIKVEQSDKGMRSSMVLEGMGKKYNAFLNGSDERLKSGTKLINIKAKTGQNSYGSYAILNSYDIAA